MIQRLGSDSESFKPLEFGPGLNILLAQKSEGAHDRQSRNGAGKTSFVELVHFLFGADAPPSGIFRSPALEDWTFSASVDIGAKRVSVARCGAKPNQVLVDGPEIESWPIVPRFDLAATRHLLSNEEWKRVLGNKWFKLTLSTDHQERFRPSYRSLVAFMARRKESEGFQRPTLHSTRQQPWDEQVSICYLLGLDWTIARRFRLLKDQEKNAKDLQRHIRSGEIGQRLGTAANLRTKLTVAAAQTDRLRKQIETFKVVPQYEKLEIEANEITEKITGLNADDLIDRNLISALEDSFEEEEMQESLEFEDVDKLYSEAGVVLPEFPRRRFEEAKTFHRAIVENRRSHLKDEIVSAQERIEERGRLKEKLDERRRQLMDILKSGGALEHYTRLREELGRAEGEVKVLSERLEMANRLENARSELGIEREKLKKALRNDILERGDIIKEAILGFEDLSKSLYERAGSLTISETANGPKFEVHIDSERSAGIKNMQIFCFDLMLTELCVRRGMSPGFLIHDSHLFDGVDERQVAKALQLGAERAESAGFQYIVTLNSDAVPREGFSAGFDIRQYFLKTRLTDATETGGLFGIRFN